jgi:hypothetical protein
MQRQGHIVHVPITSSSHVDPHSHHITGMAMAGRHADGGPSDEFVDAVDALLAAPEPPGVKKMVRMLPLLKVRASIVNFV